MSSMNTSWLAEASVVVALGTDGDSKVMVHLNTWYVLHLHISRTSVPTTDLCLPVGTEKERELHTDSSEVAPTCPDTVYSRVQTHC